MLTRLAIVGDGALDVPAAGTFVLQKFPADPQYFRIQINKNHPKQKRTAHHRVRSLCWHCLFSRSGLTIVTPLEQSGGPFQASAAHAGHKKKLLLSQELVLALPIFTARHQATIVGVSELNFCVRDGNRWTLTTINTNSHRMALHHPLYKPFARLFYW